MKPTLQDRRSRMSVTLLLAALAGSVPPSVATETPQPNGFAYAEWTDVLQRSVDARGLVDYSGLAENSEALDRVIAGIEAVSPRSYPDLFSDEQAELAYYLNGYNALVFRAVLDKGPNLKSVWGKSGTGYGFFVRNKVTVGGEKISLKKFEDDWVREGFRDPRIHAALNCASIGCPRLPREPFLPETLDAQLDSAIEEFVASPLHVEVDASAGRVALSKIFDWFTKDFIDFELQLGTIDPNLIDYVNRYRGPDEQVPRDYKIDFIKYDKRLNRQT